jgi:hypothetical protein
MAPSDVSAKERATAVLAAFFDSPNQFRQTGTDGEALPDEVVAALRSYERGDLGKPLLLPFRTPGSTVVAWYACAHDDQAWRTLQAELQAFIGPSYAWFDQPGEETLSGGEPVKSFLERHELRVIRFEASKPAYVSHILRRWRTYWSLLARQPARPVLKLRSFAHLRAAFDSALVAKNEKEARACITALRNTHGLTAENRAFLDIRLAAAFARWDEITGHPRLRDLIQVRLPPETFGDIWEALYEVHIRLYEATGKADRLLGAFVDDVQPLAGPLLKGRGRSRRPAVLKCFLLDALSQDRPVAALCADLLSAIGAVGFGAASEEIESRVQALQPRSGYAEAVREIDLERYEQAFSLLWQEDDSVDVLKALLRCAKEIADPARAADVLRRLSSAPESVATQVRADRARLLADVELLAAQVPPTTLQAQLAIPDPKEQAGGPDVLGYWREMVRARDAEELAQNRELVGELIAAVEDHALAETATFESLCPIWFEWLIERSAPLSGLIEVYRGLIESLWVRDRYGESELELIRLATLHTLRAGPRTDQYESLVNQLAKIFVIIRSPATIGWGLDTVDALAAEPCRSPEARMRFVAPVMAAAVEFYSRLEPAQRTLLRLLAQETGYQLPALPEDQTTSELPDPAVRALIYSLDRQATERAAKALGKMFPNSRFDTNDDHVCSDRLKNLARAANWILFVANVAKHQAFYCIENERSTRSRLLYAEGTGTTRLIERFINESRSPA